MFNISEEVGMQHLVVSKAHVVLCGLPLINVKGREESWSAINAAMYVTQKSTWKATFYCCGQYSARNQMLEYGRLFMCCWIPPFMEFWGS